LRIRGDCRHLEVTPECAIAVDRSLRAYPLFSEAAVPGLASTEISARTCCLNSETMAASALCNDAGVADAHLQIWQCVP